MRSWRRASVRVALPRVSARRGWAPDGTPVWEFRFTPRMSVPMPDPTRPPGLSPVREPCRPSARRVVSSRGVQVGDDTLWLDEYRYDSAEAVAPSVSSFVGTAVPPDPAGAPVAAVSPNGSGAEGGVAAALVQLAAAPGEPELNARVLALLVGAGFRPEPGRAVSAAQVAGQGVARCLDGVFVWRAEGTPGPVTYIVAPDPAVAELLKSDPTLTRAMVRAACPQPDDVLGDLETGLRDAISRLGAACATLDRAPDAPGTFPGSQVVLEVDPLPGSVVEASRAAREAGVRRALSQELAELARRVGSASVPHSVHSPRQAG